MIYIVKIKFYKKIKINYRNKILNYNNRYKYYSKKILKNKQVQILYYHLYKIKIWLNK